MSFSRWPRTHVVWVTGHEAKQWSGVSKVAFPGGFLHPLLPVNHNPSSFQFLAVTLTACVCGHLEKDIYPSRDVVRAYFSRDTFPHHIRLQFLPLHAMPERATIVPFSLSWFSCTFSSDFSCPLSVPLAVPLTVPLVLSILITITFSHLFLTC